MAACWCLCTMIVAPVFWIMCTRSGCTCCDLHHEVFKMHVRHHAQMKNEIMNGNQGDHVISVWTWRQSKQRSSFCRTFHPFIQHHDADAVHRHTLRSPDVTLLTQAGWYGLSGFEFPVAGQRCVQNITHACLFEKWTTLYNAFKAPALWKICQVWASSAARQERQSMFFNFTKKKILVNIWISNYVPCNF